MTTATTLRTRNSSSALWAKRAVAGGLLSLAPALVGLSAAADSFADTDAGKNHGTSLSRVSNQKAHAQNGGEKHHHHHRHANSHSADSGE